MQTIDEMAVVHGWPTLEFWAWGWVATLGIPAMRRVAERALGMNGVHGVLNLAAAGPAHGGLDAGQVEEMAAYNRDSLGEPIPA